MFRLLRLQLDCLGPGRGYYFVEHGDRLPTALSVFAPLEVIAAFRVVFVLAVDQDVVPGYFAVS